MIAYLYFRLCEYFKTGDLNFQRNNALIATSGLILINLGTLLFFINNIFYHKQSLLDTILSGNGFLDKFVILPLAMSPIFLFVYWLVRKKQKNKIESFRSEPSEIRKKKGLMVVLYIIITIVLFLLSIFSALFIHWQI